MVVMHMNVDKLSKNYQVKSNFTPMLIGKRKDSNLQKREGCMCLVEPNVKMRDDCYDIPVPLKAHILKKMTNVFMLF